MKKVGFIGIGIMGRSMAKNLMKAGFEVTVYTRSKEKIEDFLAETGAKWTASPAECAKGQDAVITIVGYPQDVEQVYFGENGIFEGAEKGAVLIDMTTSDPRLAQRIAAKAAELGMSALDAPVSGGDTGAKAGTLSIMVGGEDAAFEACVPLFEAMGKTIVHAGAAGAGQHTKMANQIAIAGTLCGTAEAIAYAERMGLDCDKMLKSIESGAAGSWQLSNNGKKMIAHDDNPGFFIKHFVKDMKIALAQSDEPLPVLKIVCDMCEALENNGMAELGTQAIIHSYREE